MKIFLDSNVFYNNWYISDANFNLLFYFMNNENHELLLSNLVVQEVNNIRDRELNKAISEIENLIHKAEKLNPKKLSFSTKGLGIKDYDLKSIIDQKLDSIVNIGYDEVAQEVTVHRAIKLIKPFSADEKGYRDTLIWLSFLAHLKNEGVQCEVAFITNNKHDFFENRGGSLSFHQDLLNDIQEFGIRAKITPYRNIYDFVSTIPNKEAHSFDRRELLDGQETFLIDNTEGFLDMMDKDELSYLLSAKVFYEKIASVKEIDSDIFEGLEGPRIKSVKSLKGQNVYVSCEFEMRRVDLEVTIDLIEYKQYADLLESIEFFYNVELFDDHVILSFIFRLFVTGTFEYDTKTGIAKNLSFLSVVAG